MATSTENKLVTVEELALLKSYVDNNFVDQSIYIDTIVDSGTAAMTITGGSANITVSFNIAFNSIPVVVVTPVTTSPSTSFVAVNNITSTGFTLYAESTNTYFTNSSTNKLGVKWMAIGEISSLDTLEVSK